MSVKPIWSREMVDAREMTSMGEQLLPHLEPWLGSGPSGSLPIPTWFPSHSRVGWVVLDTGQ